HHVLVDGRVVQPLFQQLGAGHAAAACNVGGVAGAKGDVAGGVLVKQGVVEQHAAFADGAGGRHQSKLADAAGVLVGGEQLAQQVGVFLGAVLHHLAVPEGHMPAVDQLAVVDVGPGTVNDAVDPVAVGRGEHLLGGD